MAGLLPPHTQTQLTQETQIQFVYEVQFNKRASLSAPEVIWRFQGTRQRDVLKFEYLEQQPVRDARLSI